MNKIQEIIEQIFNEKAEWITEHGEGKWMIGLDKFRKEFNKRTEAQE